MTTLKNILVRQALPLANIEANFPMGLPKLAPMLQQMATVFPLDLPLPDLPIGAEAVPGITGIQSLIQGVEDALPEGIPSFAEGLSQLGMGGYRPVSNKEEKPTKPYRILGGGYRSVS